MLKNATRYPSNKNEISSADIPQFEIPGYEIYELVGHGGFAKVYKGKHIQTKQIVAIKVLQFDITLAEKQRRRVVDRFERETQLCAKLHHPNIIRLLDKGCVNDQFIFAVFELIQGCTLREYLNENGALAGVETAELMGQVLDALACAHSHGIVHRDLKPQNIMVSSTGARRQIYILDFGIAAFTPEARVTDYKSLTMTQEVMGTPTYCAPEQLRGEPPTCKTDLYAWGLLFVECLTNRPAILGANLASTFAKQLSPANVPLPALIAGHPVADLLRRVLHKNTSQRAGDAVEIYQSLKSLNFSSLVGNVQSNKNAISANIVAESATTQIQSDFYTGSNSAQRKLITTLCVHLSVHPVVDGMLDEELVDALFRDQKAQCVDTVVRYGGFAAGEVGDTLLFYFGYPVVSDNDGRLCARAALDIIRYLNKRNSILSASQGIELKAQMGVHTGNVIVYNDSIPEGITPNIAMSLARKAQQNQILCSSAVRRLLGNYVDFDAQPSQFIGLSVEKAPLFSLISERQIEAVGFLRGSRSNHTFIGREKELELLVAILEGRVAGPKLMHVSGEAGIGKSRLIYEFRSIAKTYEHSVAQCLPEHKYNALYPVLNLIRLKYSIDSFSINNVLLEFRRVLGETSTEEKCDISLALLCTWLGLDMPENVALPVLSPSDQKQMLFEILTVLLCNSTNESGKSIFIFEDLHWADPVTIEFMRYFVTNDIFLSSNSGFLSTSRETIAEDLILVGFHNIEVTRLDKTNTIEFIESQFDGKKLSSLALSTVLERTDGVPLFVEELVSMLLHNGLVKDLNGYVDFADPSRFDEVPHSLRELLQQKLDSLICSRETAQLAATIGRKFEFEMLAAVSDFDGSKIKSDLNELVEADLIYLQRKVDGDSYIFKHALVRDVAYESQSRAVLIESHQKIVSLLEDGYGNIVSKEPIVYIDHMFRAGKVKDAFEKSVEVGTRLSVEGSYINSMSMTEHSINNLYRLHSDERLAVEAELRLTYSMLIMTVKGFGSQEYRENLKLISQLSINELNHDLRCSIYVSLMISFVVLSQIEEGVDKYNELEMLNISQDMKPLVHFVSGLVFLCGADMESAKREFVLAEKNYYMDSRQELEAKKRKYRQYLPYDLITAIHTHHALALLCCSEVATLVSMPDSFSPLSSQTSNDESSMARGRMQLADEQLSLAVKTIEGADDPHSLAIFYFHQAECAYYLKDFEKMKFHVSKCLHISTEHKVVTWKSMATFLYGLLQVKVESDREGLAMMQAGYNEWCLAGANSYRSWMLALLAECYALVGERKESNTFLKQSEAILDNFGEKRFAFDIKNIQQRISIERE